MDDLNEINERLSNLPQEIAYKKKIFETLKIDVNRLEGSLTLGLDKKEYTNADLRKAFVNSREEVVKINKKLAIAEADYYEAVNFFSAVLEKARNIRSEIKASHDGV